MEIFSLKTQYQLRECRELDTLNRAIIQAKDSVINNLELINNDLSEIGKNQEAIILELKEKNRQLLKENRKSIRQKRLIAIAGSVIVLVALIF